MMKPGTRVRMSEGLKRKLNGKCTPGHYLKWQPSIQTCMACSFEHVKEFENCVGVVEGPATGPRGEPWPEVTVRWHPSGLHYGYLPADLDVVS